MVTASTRIQVKLDRKFMLGNRGPATDPFFIDYKQMTKEQQRILKVLIKQVLNSFEHEGKNKPSYTDSCGNILSNAGYYRSRNYWHYHSGAWLQVQKLIVYRRNSPHHRAATNLALNYLGKTSAPCIHYVWVDPQTVRIMAYSEEHTPWLLAADSNNSQRLRAV